MANDMEHEYHRFRTMNVRQLRTRLGKITDRQKLRNFIRLCNEYGRSTIPNRLAYFDLIEEAERKLFQTQIGAVRGNDFLQRTETTSGANEIVTTTVSPMFAGPLPVAEEIPRGVLHEEFCYECNKSISSGKDRRTVVLHHLYDTNELVEFCSKKCKTTFLERKELEKKRAGVRVIKIKKG